MFIQDDDVFDVKVYYRKNKNRYMAYTEKDYKDLPEEEKTKCSVLSIRAKNMSWGLYNQLQDDAMVDSGSGERQFNFRAYKENRLKNLIKEWDAKDRDGKPVPINEKSIAHLSPAIAETILRAYDDVSLLSEEESGKS
jgi:hypothetical protein